MTSHYWIYVSGAMILWISLPLRAHCSDDSHALCEAFNEGEASNVLSVAKELEAKHSSSDAVAMLSQMLTHEDVKLRAAAAYVIGQFKDAGKSAIPALTRMLEVDDGFVVAKLLNELGTGDIPVWLAQEVVAPTDTTTNAHRALAMLSVQDKRLTPILMEGLDSQYEHVRWASVVLLGDMGVNAAAAHSALVRLVKQEPKDLSHDIRDEAAFALGCIRAKPESTVQLLTQNLKHKVPEVRKYSALGLGRMGSLGTAAIPSLIEFLEDKRGMLEPAVCAYSAHPRHSAATALVNIGTDAVPALTAALGSNQPDVRLHAAEALGYFPDEANAAADKLFFLLNDSEYSIRCEAVSSLCVVAPDDTRLIPALVLMLDDAIAEVRELVLWSLENVASRKVALKAVKRSLTDSNAAVRETARQLLGLLNFQEPRDSRTN